MEYQVIYKDQHNTNHTIIVTISDDAYFQEEQTMAIMNAILAQVSEPIVEIVSIEDYF